MRQHGSETIIGGGGRGLEGTSTQRGGASRQQRDNEVVTSYDKATRQ